MGKISDIPRLLEARFGTPMPQNRPLLECLILTVLSQNTNDRLRDKAFDRLSAAFTNWDDVLAAGQQQLAQAISVAGLANQKASTIKRLLGWSKAFGHDLSWLCQERPEQAYTTLTSIKGIGDKTAKVCLLFCCNMPFFPVDTHINRVAKRLGIAEANWSRQKVSQHMQSLFGPSTYYSLHVNLIELGRRVCKARKPLCEACPLKDICNEYASKPS